MFHRLMGSSLAAALLLFVFVAQGFAQVELKHKFAENAAVRSEMTTKIDQTLQLAGMNTETSVDVRAVKKMNAGKRAEDGVLRVSDEMESMQVSMNAQGSQYSFDSADPDTKGSSPLEAIRDLHKVLSKRKVTIVANGKNEITSVEADPNLLAGLSVELQQLVQAELNPEELKRQMIQDGARLPSEAVSKGDTWVRTENVGLGAGQVMTFQMEYKYEGTVEKGGKTLDRITSKILSVEFGLKNSPLPLEVKDSKLKASEDSTSETLFDRQVGRVVESSSSSRISGEMTFAVNNMDLPATLNLTIKTTEKELP